MSDTHVVVGAGALGTSVATDLLRRDQQVRIVNRSGSAQIPGAEALAVDATDPAALRRAFDGAAVVYQCAQPAYHRWSTEFPALQDAIIDAAAEASANIVIGDNLYPYGDPDGAVITERSPEKTATRKGTVRRQMAESALAAHRAGRLQVALSRPAHYFGPGYDQVGSMVFAPALKGKTMRWLGRMDQPHSFSYIPDVGAAMAELGVSGGGWGRVWIPPIQPALTQADFAARIWAASGQSGKARVQVLSRRMATLIGLVSPTVRQLPEMMYEFEKPYVVDSSAFEDAFDAKPTQLDDAIAATLDAYR
jgi:nucleoside-diphosphate-sugar epimerase